MSMLVDTGAWYAIADTSDQHYEEASRFYSEHADRASMVTTDLIVAETWTLLASHLGRPAALTFWGTLREVRIPVLTVDPADAEAAWHILQAFPDQAFGFVDCTTFALMERMGIHEAFAFDATFWSTGSAPDGSGRFAATLAEGAAGLLFRVVLQTGHAGA